MPIHQRFYLWLVLAITEVHRADCRFAPSQWETALLCNDVSRWLGANLQSALGTETIAVHCFWREIRCSFQKGFASLWLKSCEMFSLLWFWFWSSNQATILHMSWQLSCHDICKTVTCPDSFFSEVQQCEFLQELDHEFFVKWVPKTL